MELTNLEMGGANAHNDEPTVCEYDGDPRQWACMTEEQCDDCFMVDHLKECEWCEHYDHPSRKLKVQHDTGERRFFPTSKLDKWAYELMEHQADAERRHGEERVSANQE